MSGKIRPGLLCEIAENKGRIDAKGGVPIITFCCQRNKVLLRGSAYNFYSTPFRIIYTSSDTSRIEIGDILDASNGVETYRIDKICDGNIQRYLICTPLHVIEEESHENGSNKQEG